MESGQELFNIARVRAPLAKRTDGAGEVILATSGTAVLVKIPTWMQGKYCEFKSVGGQSDVLFGDSTVAAVYGQASTVSSNTITVHAATGRRISDGETRSWRVPTPGDVGLERTATLYMSVISSGTAALHIGLGSDNLVGHTRG